MGMAVGVDMAIVVVEAAAIAGAVEKGRKKKVCPLNSEDISP